MSLKKAQLIMYEQKLERENWILVSMDSETKDEEPRQEWGEGGGWGGGEGSVSPGYVHKY